MIKEAFLQWQNKINFSKKINITILLFFLFILTYLTTNHFALWGPWQLPLSNIEKQIPFLPWTVCIYLSTYLLIILAILAIPSKFIQQALIGMIGIIIIQSLFFVIIPTYYPRPPFPTDISLINYYLYKFLVIFDTPQNCFPSQHVSLTAFLSIFIFLKNKKIGSLFLFWSLLIIISTLTLKQHYLWDVIGGLIVAIAMISISLRQTWRFSLFSK